MRELLGLETMMLVTLLTSTLEVAVATPLMAGPQKMV